MGEVILFPKQEEEITPRKLLKHAREHKFDQIVIIGVKGKEPSLMSSETVSSTLYLLELAKRGLFEE